MVMASMIAVMRWPSASHQPARTNQERCKESQVGQSLDRYVHNTRRVTRLSGRRSAMLNAARVQGRPIMVIAMTTAAIIQPAAIQDTENDP